MFSEIMSLALGNGLWAALFCLLFLYQLKDSRLREKKYTLTISSLTNALGALESVKSDCKSIKTVCESVKTDCKLIRKDCIVIKKNLALTAKSAKSGAGKKDCKPEDEQPLNAAKSSVSQKAVRPSLTVLAANAAAGGQSNEL